jgi:serine protease inhibitor
MMFFKEVCKEKQPESSKYTWHKASVDIPILYRIQLSEAGQIAPIIGKVVKENRMGPF